MKFKFKPCFKGARIVNSKYEWKDERGCVDQCVEDVAEWSCWRLAYDHTVTWDNCPMGKCQLVETPEVEK